MALQSLKSADHNGITNSRSEAKYLVAINENVPDVNSFIQGIQTYLQVENTLQSQHLNECITQHRMIDVLGTEKESSVSSIRTANKKVYDTKMSLDKAEKSESRMRAFLELTEQFLVKDLHRRVNEAPDNSTVVPLLETYQHPFEDNEQRTPVVHFNVLVVQRQIDGLTMQSIINQIAISESKTQLLKKVISNEGTELQILISESKGIDAARTDLTNKVKVCSLKLINLILRPNDTKPLLPLARRTELLNNEEVKTWIQNSDLLSLLDRITEIYKPGKTPHQQSELIAKFRALAPSMKTSETWESFIFRWKMDLRLLTTYGIIIPESDKVFDLEKVIKTYYRTPEIVNYLTRISFKEDSFGYIPRCDTAEDFISCVENIVSSSNATRIGYHSDVIHLPMIVDASMAGLHRSLAMKANSVDTPGRVISNVNEGEINAVGNAGQDQIEATDEIQRLKKQINKLRCSCGNGKGLHLESQCRTAIAKDPDLMEKVQHLLQQISTKKEIKQINEGSNAKKDIKRPGKPKGIQKSASTGVLNPNQSSINSVQSNLENHITYDEEAFMEAMGSIFMLEELNSANTVSGGTDHQNLFLNDNGSAVPAIFNTDATAGPELCLFTSLERKQKTLGGFITGTAVRVEGVGFVPCLTPAYYDSRARNIVGEEHLRKAGIEVTNLFEDNNRPLETTRIRYRNAKGTIIYCTKRGNDDSVLFFGKMSELKHLLFEHYDYNHMHLNNHSRDLSAHDIQTPTWPPTWLHSVTSEDSNSILNTIHHEQPPAMNPTINEIRLNRCRYGSPLSSSQWSRLHYRSQNSTYEQDNSYLGLCHLALLSQNINEETAQWASTLLNDCMISTEPIEGELGHWYEPESRLVSQINSSEIMIQARLMQESFTNSDSDEDIPELILDDEGEMVAHLSTNAPTRSTTRTRIPNRQMEDFELTTVNRRSRRSSVKHEADHDELNEDEITNGTGHDEPEHFRATEYYRKDDEDDDEQDSSIQQPTNLGDSSSSEEPLRGEVYSSDTTNSDHDTRVRGGDSAQSIPTDVQKIMEWRNQVNAKGPLLRHPLPHELHGSTSRNSFQRLCLRGRPVTEAEFKRAIQVLLFHRAMSHMSFDKMRKYLCRRGNGGVINIGFTEADMDNAVELFGECPYCIASKLRAPPQSPTIIPTNAPPGVHFELDHFFVRFDETGKLAPIMLVVELVTGFLFGLNMKGSRSNRSHYLAGLDFKLARDKHFPNAPSKFYLYTDHEDAFERVAEASPGAERLPKPIGDHANSCEREIGMIAELMRATLSERKASGVKVLGKHHPRLAAHTIIVLNLSPRGTNEGLSPNELVRGKKLEYTDALELSWGQVGLAKYPGDGTSEEDRGHLVMMIGTEPGTPTNFICYDPITKMAVSRCKFIAHPGLVPTWNELVAAECSYQPATEEQGAYSAKSVIEAEEITDPAASVNTTHASADFDDSNMSTDLAIEHFGTTAVLDALKAEFTNIIDVYNVMTFVKPSSDGFVKGKRPIPSKVFFKAKYVTNTTTGKPQFDKLKARLAAGGHRQKLEENVRTSSPTVATSSILTMTSINKLIKGDIHCGDVPAAYLNAELPVDQQLLMMLPKPITKLMLKLYPMLADKVGPDGCLVVKLLKALYGLKQAGVCWYNLLIKTLIEAGLTQSRVDACVFYKCEPPLYLICGFHVDDIMTVCNHEPWQQHIVKELNKRFGNFEFAKRHFGFLGMYFNQQDDHSVKVDMSSMTHRFIERWQVDGTVDTPHTIELFSDLDDSSVDYSANTEKYLSIVCAMMFLIRIRVDIMLVVTFLATLAKNPGPKAFKKVRRVQQYLNATPNKSAVYGAETPVVQVFCDVSFASHPESSRSHTGIIGRIGERGGAVIAKSQAQRIVTGSSTEGELLGVCAGVRLMYAPARHLVDWKFNAKSKITAFQDNQSTLIIASGGEGYAGKAKHFRVRYHFLKEMMDDGTLAMLYCPTDLMVADFLTKPLPGVRYLMLVDAAMGLTVLPVSKRG